MFVFTFSHLPFSIYHSSHKTIETFKKKQPCNNLKKCLWDHQKC